jgi:hypothetical protein
MVLYYTGLFYPFVTFQPAFINAGIEYISHLVAGEQTALAAVIDSLFLGTFQDEASRYAGFGIRIVPASVALRLGKQEQVIIEFLKRVCP